LEASRPEPLSDELAQKRTLVGNSLDRHAANQAMQRCCVGSNDDRTGVLALSWTIAHLKWIAFNLPREVAGRVSRANSHKIVVELWRNRIPWQRLTAAPD
jgi:hypothetical protein